MPKDKPVKRRMNCATAQRKTKYLFSKNMLAVLVRFRCHIAPNSVGNVCTQSCIHKTNTELYQLVVIGIQTQ